MKFGVVAAVAVAGSGVFKRERKSITLSCTFSPGSSRSSSRRVLKKKKIRKLYNTYTYSVHVIHGLCVVFCEPANCLDVIKDLKATFNASARRVG